MNSKAKLRENLVTWFTFAVCRKRNSITLYCDNKSLQCMRMRADKGRKGWWEMLPSARVGEGEGELGFQDPHLLLRLQHHMNNEGFASPALRRSQLATALSKREIPATEAPFEPCNDLGPTCSSYLTRPWSRQEKYVVLFQVQPKIKFSRTYTTFVFEMYLFPER